MRNTLDERRLRRLGGACLIVLGLAFLIFFVVFIFVASQSSTPGAQLREGASHPWLVRLLALTNVVGEAALVPGAVVLYLVLAPLARLRCAIAAIALVLAAIVGVAFEIFELAAAQVAVGYASASTDAARAGYLAASVLADAGVTWGSLLWVFFFGMGLLLFGSAMLGSAFPRWLAYFSLVLGGLGILGVVLGTVAPPVLGLAFAVYVISILWNLATGVVLYCSGATAMLSNQTPA
jgi:hypothetical protein